MKRKKHEKYKKNKVEKKFDFVEKVHGNALKKGNVWKDKTNNKFMEVKERKEYENGAIGLVSKEVQA